MRRRTILILAAVLAVLAGLAPIVATAYWSRQRAIDAERAHMNEYARWTLMRATMTLSQAEDALRAVEGRGGACAPADIAFMRRLAVEAPSIKEVAVFSDGHLDCTSWGKVAHGVASQPADYVLPSGFNLYLNVHPMISRGSSMLGLSRGRYGTLINPNRMVDVLPDSNMTIGIATGDGRLIAASGPADPALIKRLTHKVVTGDDKHHIYASTRGDGLMAFALTDTRAIQARLDQQFLLLAPLGLLISVLMVLLVIRIYRQRLSPKKELETAIRRKEFVAYYQPIIELSTGLCVGAEALVRWRRRDGTLVMPDMFIALAEQTGLIRPLTDLMIRQIVADMDRMLSEERSLHIALNISAGDLETGRFLPVLGDALRRSGIKPSQIWLEATERGFINAEAARATIEQARLQGHFIAIDDFGTGYSSLSLIESLPLDALKIDKSFIAAIGQGAATSVVTPHIIDMAHGLKLSMVAEGIETEEQESFVREAGVQLAQGWFYSKALPPQDFVAFYRERNAGQVSPFLAGISLYGTQAPETQVPDIQAAE